MTRYTQIMKGRQGDYMAESPTGEWVKAADVEAVEERSKFLEAENPYASKEWSDLVAASGKAKGDVLAAKLLISQLQHALAAKEAALAEVLRVVSGVIGGARSLYEHYTSPKPDCSRVPKDLSLYVIQPLEELTNGK